MLRLDLEDLHGPLLAGVQTFGLLAAPLGLVPLGSGVLQDHCLVAQHALQIVLRFLLHAAPQESLGEGLGSGAGLGLETKSIKSPECKTGSNTETFSREHGHKLKAEESSVLPRHPEPSPGPEESWPEQALLSKRDHR